MFPTFIPLLWTLSLACEPSEYAGMGNACPSVSEAYAAAENCDQSAAEVEKMCKGSRTTATIEGCQTDFDEYYHCIAAWAETGSDNLTLKCGKNSWGLKSNSGGKEQWCIKESDSLDYCRE